MNPYTEQVKRGAALLDQKRPGWRESIDLSALEVSLGKPSGTTTMESLLSGE